MQNGTLDSGAVDILRKEFSGQIITPSDDGYDDARRVWNGTVDKKPGAIAQATGVPDVVAAVNFARDRDLLLAIRCGAHSGPGLSSCDGGLVLDLSPMNSVTVDPDRRTAVVAGGALLGDLDRASQAHGLATTAGVVSHTGVGGLTLGGGVGRLMRKHGLTIDNLTACEVVTASGEVVRASEDEEPELFWALRGAGHNFGVVTSFEFRLHPVGPNVLAAMAVYPIDQGLDVYHAYKDFTAGLPDDIASACNVVTIPASMPFPAEIHGIKAVFAVAMHVDGNASPETLAGLAGLGTPAFKLTMPMPYLMLQSMADDVYKWGQRNYVKGALLREITDGAVQAALDAVASAPGPRCEVDILQGGGAISRVPEDDTAYSGRAAPFFLNIQAVWQEPSADAAHKKWAKDVHAAMSDAFHGTNYVNLMEDLDADVSEIYGKHKWDRLVALKRKWDPGNLFRLNQNIKP